MSITAIVAVCQVAVPGVAQEAPEPKSSSETALRLLPETSTTRHTLHVDGRTIRYTATAGTLPLRDEQGEIVAEVFRVDYTVAPPAEDRPITFVFNGGPGAASAFLHLGGLGPRVVAFSEAGGYFPPPARLVDNPDTWLAFTDLVFVDPVGTGYSRAAEPEDEAADRFFGVRQDASAMAAFIRLYLARAGRSLSPVFLAGESYGGFRAAVLLATLQEEVGIAPRGAVLISPALDFALLRGEDHALLPPALLLPSLAAAHLAHQGVSGEELAARLRDVERFALGNYLVGLAMGWGELPATAEAALSRFTGLEPELIERTGGRISASSFIKAYERESGRVLSRYDATIEGPDPDPSSPGHRGPDPVLDRAVSVWTSAFVRYVRERLGYQTDLSYRLLHGEAHREWDYGTSPTRQGFADALDELQTARSVDPSLEILVAHGYTDLVTPYFASRYLLDQLPPLAGAAPITERVYPGGHMMYMRPGSRRALAEDARMLYERALAPAQ